MGIYITHTEIDTSQPKTPVAVRPVRRRSRRFAVRRPGRPGRFLLLRLAPQLRLPGGLGAGLGPGWQRCPKRRKR